MGTPKKIVGQLKKNTKVELCFYKHGEGARTTMRVTGKAEFLNEKTLKDRLFREAPRVKF